MKYVKIFILLLVTCYLSLVTCKQTAAAPFSLSINPPTIYVDVQTLPATIKTPFTITNNGETTALLYTRILPFNADGEYGQIAFTGESTPVEPFVKILRGTEPIRELSLPAGQSQELTLLIELPKEFPKEDSYFSLVFSNKTLLVPISQSNISQSNISQNKNLEEDLPAGRQEGQVSAFSQLRGGIGTNVIVAMGPEQNPTNALKTTFQTSRFWESGPVDFSLRLENRGERALPVEGEIFIENMFGQTIGSVKLPAAHILAESSRTYKNVVWPETFLLGPYVALVKFDTSSGGGTTSIVTQTTFLSFPHWKLSTGVFTALLLLWALFRIRRRVHLS